MERIVVKRILLSDIEYCNVKVLSLFAIASLVILLNKFMHLIQTAAWRMGGSVYLIQ